MEGIMDLDRKKTKERERSSNFNPQEVQLLISLVRQHPKKYVNCSQTGINTGQIRQETWDRISQQFNARMGGMTYRSPKVLRTKYKNIRKINITPAAKRFADLKYNSIGLQKGVVTMQMDDKIKEIHMPKPNVTRAKSRCDDFANEDALFNDETEPNPDEVVISELGVVKNEPFELSNTGEFEEEPCRLITADPLTIPPTVSRGKTNHINNTALSLHQYEELANLQKQAFLEEHRLKITHMTEKHQKTIQLMEEESKLKMEFLKREHEVRMELIKNRDQSN